MTSPLTDAATQLAETQANVVGLTRANDAMASLTVAARDAASSMQVDSNALAGRLKTVATLQAQLKALGGA